MPGFQNKINEKIVLNHEEIKPAMKLNGNKGTEFHINGVLECLYLKNNEKCRIFVGPVTSSVFVDNCQDCEIVVMAHQVKLN